MQAAWTFANGVKTDATAGFPVVGELVYFFPALNVTTANVAFSSKNPATDAKRYQSFDLYYGDRQGRVIHHTTEFLP